MSGLRLPAIMPISRFLFEPAEEAEHVEGFAEIAWVTHGGNEN